MRDAGEGLHVVEFAHVDVILAASTCPAVVGFEALQVEAVFEIWVGIVLAELTCLVICVSSFVELAHELFMLARPHGV